MTQLLENVLNKRQKMNTKHDISSESISDLLRTAEKGQMTEGQASALREALEIEAHKGEAWRKVAQAAHLSVGLNTIGTMGAEAESGRRDESTRTIPLWRKMTKVALRAAAVLLPLAVALWFVIVDPMGNSTTYIAEAQNDTVALPDGSQVILYQGSKLTYAQAETERRVELEGLARFEVKHDESMPFVVNAQQAQVRVLGTVFSVEHWQGAERVRTRVEQGKVAMTAASGKSVTLTAQQEATWDGHHLTKCSMACSNTVLGSRNITFNKASLQQVANELLTCYHGEIKGVNFNCSEDSTLITTAFEDQSLESVLEELTMHFGKKLSIRNGYLTISD